MINTYSRTITLQRAEAAPLGTVRAVLATDGEASDGHVLSIRGGELTPGIPLLFGHDSGSGRSNLGSWSSFTRQPHEIHGEATIELNGEGTQREWRADVAHMIAAGHIGSVSVRWEPISKPIKRTAMPQAHSSYVDEKRETDYAKLNGYYFPKWRALEGSIVTLGADKAALIKRSLETSGEVSELWRTMAEELEDEELYDEASDAPIDDAPEADGPEPVAEPARAPAPAVVIPSAATVAVLTYDDMLRALWVRIDAANQKLVSDMQTRAAELFAAVRGRK